MTHEHPADEANRQERQDWNSVPLAPLKKPTKAGSSAGKYAHVSID